MLDRNLELIIYIVNRNKSGSLMCFHSFSSKFSKTAISVSKTYGSLGEIRNRGKLFHLTLRKHWTKKEERTSGNFDYP